MRPSNLTLLFILLATCYGCLQKNIPETDKKVITITLDSQCYKTKSSDPDEEKISQVDLLIFDEYERLEKHIRIHDYSDSPCNVQLLRNKKYRFVALVNFEKGTTVRNYKELQDLRFHLVYPDEYRNGIPMYADSGLLPCDKTQNVVLKLTRLMSKINIRIDRNRLSDGIEMIVRGIRIGNCPKSCFVFKPNTVADSDDCFPLGFNKTGEKCQELNHYIEKGISGDVCLYMLENMQGTFGPDVLESDEEKVFDNNDPRKDICSFIEIDFDYISKDKISSDGYLQYRFYLGSGRNDLNIERNSIYSITICPEDDGLNGDGWRVDKSSIVPNQPTSFMSYPDGYIRGNIGDTVHIGCRFTPEDAPFDVGIEYMEYDKSQGIYDFVIDDDGHGAILTLTGPGSGLIYMSAGPPVNESALWFIEVNLPAF